MFVILSETRGDVIVITRQNSSHNPGHNLLLDTTARYTFCRHVGMILLINHTTCNNINMKFLITPSALLLSLVMSSPALAQNQNPSIMFQQPEENQGFMGASPGDSDMATRCAEMARQIELLRGKPQRRYIAIKRYELECKGESFDYDRYDNEGISK